MLEDGTVNGLVAVPKLKEHGLVEAASSITALVLVSLCEHSFNYCLATIPSGKHVDQNTLHSIHDQVYSAGKDVGLDMRSLKGDGDSKVRVVTKAHHYHIPRRYSWSEKEEYPIVYGLGLDKRAIPMQDSLHVIKKLRNNGKFLSTKLLLFCNLDTLTFDERYKYTVRWDVILYLMYELMSRTKTSETQ